MRDGRFAEAWAHADRHRSPIPDDEWRWPRHLQRVWRGTPLTGRHVLIRCYHGLGDTLQFVRYVEPLRAMASEVTLWVQPPLIPVLTGLAGVDRLLPLHDGTPEVEADVDVEIMELPYIFRSTLETLPRRVPYLPLVSPLPPPARPAIGLLWRAGDWNPQRSLPFAEAATLTRGLRGSLTTLQQSLTADEARTFAPPRSATSIAVMARELAGLDLVISVDTMCAHLAGALGRPTWLLLDADADWRWMRRRDDSPWYPTMRLFRQPVPGDWSSVVRETRQHLEGWLDRACVARGAAAW